MGKIIFYAIVIIALGLLFKFGSKFIDSLGKSKKLPYKKREFLLNISERQLFEFLQTVLPSSYVIFPQIVMSSILKVDSPKEEFHKYQNKINRKILDFVVFEKKNLVPVLAIEYDGPTHKQAKRIERDEFVDSALKSAGIKILHVKHERNINLEKVGNEVVTMLS